MYATQGQNFYFNLRRDDQKISYDRRYYESEERKEPILGYICLGKTTKKNSGSKGLKSKFSPYAHYCTQYATKS